MFWRLFPSEQARGLQQYKSSIAEERWLSIDGGKKLYIHIHRPDAEGIFPAVVLVPGAEEAGTSFDGGWFRAEDITRTGIIAVHFDPQGRGKSDGKEDYWGPVHQEDLHRVIKYVASLPYADKNSIGVLSFSIGIIIAAGALARFREEIRVKYLMDWEGPSNRHNTTKNDTHQPLKRFPTTDNSFWDVREASRYIGDINCAYLRFQGEIDHVQGAYKGHAVELVNNAVKGGVKWSRCNDNPPNITYDDRLFDSYRWIPKWADHRAIMLRFLSELADSDGLKKKGAIY